MVALTSLVNQNVKDAFSGFRLVKELLPDLLQHTRPFRTRDQPRMRHRLHHHHRQEELLW